MFISPSPLERWFTEHPGPYAHSLASTAVSAPSWRELQAYLTDSGMPDIDLGYAEPEGDRELRAALAAEYGLPALDHVLLTHGAVEANWLALATLVRPGMRVVVQTPIYPQLPLVVEGLGGHVIPWQSPWRASAMDWRDIQLVVLNSPHNPTGAVIESEEIGFIVDQMRRNRGHVLVDEVYRGVGEAEMAPSALNWGSECVLVSASLSKAWALPGLRLGWLAGAVDVVKGAIPLREHTTLALAGPSLALAKALWPHRDRVQADNRQILKRNRAIIASWGAAPTTAGVLLKAHSGDDMAIAEAWYRECKGLVIPGTVCGYPGHFRIGFGHRDPAALEAALNSFERYL